jgi:hypothetical protein
MDEEEEVEAPNGEIMMVQDEEEDILDEDE